MITWWFALICLAIACLVVSLVYAMTSPGRPEHMAKETVHGFGMMLGGILLLAVCIKIISFVFRTG